MSHVKDTKAQAKRAALVAAGLCERCREPRGEHGTSRMCRTCASAVAAYARESRNSPSPVLGFRGLAAECLRVAREVNEQCPLSATPGTPSDEDLAVAVVLAGWRIGPDRKRVVRLFRNDPRAGRYSDNLKASGLWLESQVVVETLDDDDRPGLFTVELLLQSLVAQGKARWSPMAGPDVQGYLPAVRRKGRFIYFAFGGGTTDNADKAFCVPLEEATRIARKEFRGRRPDDDSMAVPVDTHAKPMTGQAILL